MAQSPPPPPPNKDYAAGLRSFKYLHLLFINLILLHDTVINSDKDYRNLSIDRRTKY